MKVLHAESILKESFEMRRRAIQTVEGTIETDLGVIATLIRLSEDSYLRSNQRNGDRAKAEANKALQKIRELLSRPNVLGEISAQSIIHRCDELERALAFNQR